MVSSITKVSSWEGSAGLTVVGAGASSSSIAAPVPPKEPATSELPASPGVSCSAVSPSSSSPGAAAAGSDGARADAAELYLTLRISFKLWTTSDLIEQEDVMNRVPSQQNIVLHEHICLDFEVVLQTMGLERFGVFLHSRVKYFA